MSGPIVSCKSLEDIFNALNVAWEVKRPDPKPGRILPGSLIQLDSEWKTNRDPVNQDRAALNRQQIEDISLVQYDNTGAIALRLKTASPVKLIIQSIDEAMGLVSAYLDGAIRLFGLSRNNNRFTILEKRNRADQVQEWQLFTANAKALAKIDVKGIYSRQDGTLQARILPTVTGAMPQMDGKTSLHINTIYNGLPQESKTIFEENLGFGF